MALPKTKQKKLKSLQSQLARYSKNPNKAKEIELKIKELEKSPKK